MTRSDLLLSFISGPKAKVSKSMALLWEVWACRENNLLATHLGQNFIFSHEDLLALLWAFAWLGSVSVGAVGAQLCESC